jgi:hypothetical protein
MWNRVVGFVPEGADTLLRTLYINMKVWDGESATHNEDIHQHLSLSSANSSTSPTAAQHRNSSSSSSAPPPFEMRAYEAIFGTVVEILKQEEKNLREKIDQIVSILNKYSIVPVKVQDKVRQYKHEVAEKMQRVQAHLNVIQDVMDDDEQMALMNLSILREKPALYRPPLSSEIMGTHEEIEVPVSSLLLPLMTSSSRLLGNARLVDHGLQRHPHSPESLSLQTRELRGYGHPPSPSLLTLCRFHCD